MPRPRSVKATAELAGSAAIFAALGDQTRLTLMSRLCDGGPTSLARLAAGFDITRQAITKHLRVMEEAGMVRHTQIGRESIWHVKQKRLAEIRRHLHAISSQWETRLGRLKSLVER